jgi:hypothetical protein
LTNFGYVNLGLVGLFSLLVTLMILRTTLKKVLKIFYNWIKRRLALHRKRKAEKARLEELKNRPKDKSSSALTAEDKVGIQLKVINRLNTTSMMIDEIGKPEGVEKPSNGLNLVSPRDSDEESGSSYGSEDSEEAGNTPDKEILEDEDHKFTTKKSNKVGPNTEESLKSSKSDMVDIYSKSKMH